MKTHANILTHSPVDSAPLAASISRLCLSVIALLDSRLHKAAFEAVRRTQQAVSRFCQAERANHQRAVKLEMLSHKYWRRLVLKELGGARALARWRKGLKRCEARREEWRQAMERAPRPDPIPSAWRKSPERMAEELRQKAHAQSCAKTAAHPRIMRDPCKMDFDGEFRLPPLPRLCGPRRADAAWTTPFDIMDYHYNPMPMSALKGYDAPIIVWPAEFEAAELWDYERWLRDRSVRRVDEESLTAKAQPHVKPTEDDASFVIPSLNPHLTTQSAAAVRPRGKPEITKGRGQLFCSLKTRHLLSLGGHNLSEDSADERAT